MLSYPVIDRDRERLVADLGYVRQVQATSSVAQPTRRARWHTWIRPAPRPLPAHTSGLGVH